MYTIFKEVSTIHANKYNFKNRHDNLRENCQTSSKGKSFYKSTNMLYPERISRNGKME